MKIAIDFDGTLVEPSKFPTFKYKLKPNAKEVLNRLSKKGIVFILNTARYTWYRLPAIYYIKKNKLPIQTHLFNKKPQCDLYVDDANIFCKEIDWLKIEKEILKRSKKCLF